MTVAIAIGLAGAFVLWAVVELWERHREGRKLRRLRDSDSDE